MDLFESSAKSLAKDAAALFLLSDQPQLLHQNRQCIFAFPKDNKILRIHSLEDTEDSVLLERKRALTASESGVLTPYDSTTPTPVIVKDRIIECLPLLRRLPGQPPIDFAELGRQLKSLHANEDSDLPCVNPLDRLQQRIQLRPASDRLLQVLESRVPLLHAFWDSLVDRYEGVFLHGNVCRSNIIRCDSGQHLIDFHAGGLGPWVFDLACVNLSVRRFSLHPLQYKKMLQHYGRDITMRAEMDIDKLVDLLELMSLGWLHSRHNTQADLEVSWRLRTLDSRIPWHRF